MRLICALRRNESLPPDVGVSLRKVFVGKFFEAVSFRPTAASSMSVPSSGAKRGDLLI